MTLKDVPVDEITRVISLATAPAFLLGAVAGLLSLLVSRLARTADLVRTLMRDQENIGASERTALLRRTLQRIDHTRRAITLCAFSGIVTGWMVVLTFVDALFGFHNSQAIAAAFILAMVLFTSALVLLLVEVRLSVADLASVRNSIQDL